MAGCTARIPRTHRPKPTDCDKGASKIKDRKQKLLLARLPRILGILLLLNVLIFLPEGSENMQLEEAVIVQDSASIIHTRRSIQSEESNPKIPLQRSYEYESSAYTYGGNNMKSQVSITAATNRSLSLSRTTTATTNTTTNTASVPHGYNSNNNNNNNNNGSNSFAACMMWMDDTERLVEWIAYHYHTLPLRRLILFRDPRSAKNLTSVVNRWKSFIQITLWTRVENFPHYRLKRLAARRGTDNPTVHEQKGFIRNCLKQLQKEHWTWTFVGDVDEFLVLKGKNVPNAQQLMKRPGILLEIIKGARATQKIPHTQTSLTQTQLHRWGDPNVSCMCLGRVQFGGFESPHEAVIKDYVPYSHIQWKLDPYRFQTLRFRHHRRKGVICKSIVDVSNVEINSTVWMSHHKTFQHSCGDRWGRQEDLMHVHHHFGSYEAYLRPNDYRVERNSKAYYKRNAWVMETLRSDFGDEARQWLGGFVQHFGEKKALELLEGVGFPYNNGTALERIVEGRRDKDGSTLIVRPPNNTAENERMSNFEKGLHRVII